MLGKPLTQDLKLRDLIESEVMPTPLPPTIDGADFDKKTKAMGVRARLDQHGIPFKSIMQPPSTHRMVLANGAPKVSKIKG